MKKYIVKILSRIKGEVDIRKLIASGLKVGKNCKFRTGVIIDQNHCWLVEIGDNVTFAPRVHIIAHDASTKKLTGYVRIGKVKIDDNVFIGAGSIVLPNVHIGSNSIIGAGSVITRSVPPDVVAAGNPARVICTVGDFLNKHMEQMSVYPCFGEDFTARRDITESMKAEMKSRMGDGQGYVI